MEKELERRAPPAERDDIRVAGNRCPYCHDEVARESADVCRDCLARHHPACWAEAPRCGSCGSVEVLRPIRRDPLSSNEARAIVAETLRSEGFATDGLEPARCTAPGCHEPRAERKLRCQRHVDAARRHGRRLAGLALGSAGLAMIAVGAVQAIRSGSAAPLVGAVCMAGALFATGMFVPGYVGDPD